MKFHRTTLILVLLVGLFLFAFNLPIVHAQTASPVVRAVLFYSPSCPHCHYVITETLPPLAAKYGDQLKIVGVDVSQANGEILFVAALQKFGLEAGGVPFLVVGDTYLIGSGDIPEQFPGLIETYLAQGGVDWPDIPGLREALFPTTAPATMTPAESSTPLQGPTTAAVSPAGTPPAAIPDLLSASVETPNWRENFARDLPGNTLAVFVLLGMLGAVVWTARDFFSRAKKRVREWTWVVPVLCVLGFGIAGYLSYVEVTQVTAVCGPVGDCNTVQQSEYARLFGVLPIGLLGMAGYVAIFVTRVVRRNVRGRLEDILVMFLFAMTVFGTLFSIYLTFLEPFVIGASCAWCLTSAMIMTILMLISEKPALSASSKQRRARSSSRKNSRVGI